MGGALSFAAVGVGAAVGAWLRWALAVGLAAAHPKLPGGTLVANLAGAYLIGIALGFFASYPQLSPEWRLFAITGFLGGLTTFSTFSGEAMVLLQRGDYGWAVAHSALHLMGSILCCIAGYASWRLFSS
jgi:fluoride exporter